MDASGLAACDSYHFRDSWGGDWSSENVYGQNPHFSDPELDRDYSSFLVPAQPLDTPSPIMLDDAFPDMYGTDFQSCKYDSPPCIAEKRIDSSGSGCSVNYMRLPSSTEDERIRPASERNVFDGLFTVDNFSTPSSPDTHNAPGLAPTINTADVEKYPSMLDKLSVSVDNICTAFERFSKRLSDASTLIGRLQLQAESVSNSTTAAFDGFNGKVDGLSGRIDGLVETVEEIVKRERIAMEKFGNFAGHIDQPTSSLGSQSGMNLHRRSSG